MKLKVDNGLGGVDYAERESEPEKGCTSEIGHYFFFGGGGICIFCGLHSKLAEEITKPRAIQFYEPEHE